MRNEISASVFDKKREIVLAPRYVCKYTVSIVYGFHGFSSWKKKKSVSDAKIKEFNVHVGSSKIYNTNFTKAKELRSSWECEKLVT